MPCNKELIRLSVIIDNFTYKYLYYSWGVMTIFISIIAQADKEIAGGSVAFILILLLNIMLAQLMYEGEQFYKAYVDRIQQIIDEKLMPLPHPEDMPEFRLSLTCGSMLREHTPYKVMIWYSFLSLALDVAAIWLIHHFGAGGEPYSLSLIEFSIMGGLCFMDAVGFFIRFFMMRNGQQVEHYNIKIEAREFYYVAKYRIVHAHDEYRVPGLRYKPAKVPNPLDYEKFSLTSAEEPKELGDPHGKLKETTQQLRKRKSRKGAAADPLVHPS